MIYDLVALRWIRRWNVLSWADIVGGTAERGQSSPIFNVRIGGALPLQR